MTDTRTLNDILDDLTNEYNEAKDKLDEIASAQYAAERALEAMSDLLTELDALTTEEK